MHNYKISTISKRTALSVAIASLFSAQAMAQQAQLKAQTQAVSVIVDACETLAQRNIP